MTSLRHTLRSLTANILTLAFILPLCCISCQAENASTSAPTALPSTLIGTWQVAEVHTDQGESHWHRTRDDKYNIHKFLGRVFSFTAHVVTTNAPDGKRCDNPKIIVHRSTAANVVGTSIASRGFSPVLPTAKDFQLPLTDNAPIDVLSLLCKEGLFGKNLGGGQNPDVGIKGVWLIVLNKEQLALRWHDETILILKRLPENAKPIASFDCTGAATEVEKIICGSVALAAYDQSVTQTYKLVLEYYQTKKNTDNQIAELKKSQQQWLTQRDACGSDIACLEKAMEERIDGIDYGLATYGYENR